MKKDFNPANVIIIGETGVQQEIKEKEEANKDREESDIIKEFNEDSGLNFRDDYVVDDDLFDELDLSRDELDELEGAYIDTGYNAGDALLAGVEIDSSMIGVLG